MVPQGCIYQKPIEVEIMVPTCTHGAHSAASLHHSPGWSSTDTPRQQTYPRDRCKGFVERCGGFAGRLASPGGAALRQRSCCSAAAGKKFGLLAHSDTSDLFGRFGLFWEFREFLGLWARLIPQTIVNTKVWPELGQHTSDLAENLHATIYMHKQNFDQAWRPGIAKMRPEISRTNSQKLKEIRADFWTLRWFDFIVLIFACGI